MIAAEVKSRDSLLANYSKTLTILGINIAQRYIVDIAKQYYRLHKIPFYAIDTKLLDTGTSILLYLMKHKLVVVDSIQSNQVFLRPCNEIPFQDIDKIYKAVDDLYPLYSEPLNYSLQWVLGEYIPTIIHHTGIANVNSVNKHILKKLSNISFEITDEFSEYPRIPKTGIANVDTNYILETHLQKQTQKEYNGEVIYFPFQFDKRGRIYCKSYRINTQSDEWNKACINFAFKEKVSFTGMMTLKKEVAIQYGLDKKTSVEKLQWFQANEEYVLEVANKNILDKEADKPILFQKACKAYRDAKAGLPIGYMCSIDATASGLQLLSIITKDKESAKYTNLTSLEKRFDIYTEFATNFLMMLDMETSPERLKKARKVIKPCLMTHFYNSVVGVRKKLGNNQEYYDTFTALTREMCQGPSEFLDYITEIYQQNNHKKYFCWTMPDGFEVVIEQQKDSYHKINTPYFQCLFKYQAIAVDAEQNKRKLAAHIVHSIDAFVCRELIRRCKFEISPIHDSFYAHPNNINTILATYQEILQEINNGKYKTLLSDIISDITGVKTKTPFDDKEPLNDIRESHYCLS